jgi:hypothetical protein
MLPQEISKPQTRHRKQSALPHLISGTSEEDISSMLLHCLVSRGQLVSGGRAEAMLLLHARLLTLSPPIGAEACKLWPLLTVCKFVYQQAYADFGLAAFPQKVELGCAGLPVVSWCSIFVLRCPGRCSLALPSAESTLSCSKLQGKTSCCVQTIYVYNRMTVHEALQICYQESVIG